jgi:glycosyltransferase involved in cell wall biosynthesis
VVSLVREGLALGQRLGVVCLVRRGPLAERLASMGVAVPCLDKLPGIRLGTATRLARVVTSFSPDVVHSHEIGCLFYAGLATRQAGRIPIVHTEHGRNCAYSFRRRTLTRLAGLFAERFFCVSDDIAAEVISRRLVAKRKVGIVRNGIDTAAFAAADGREDVRRSLGIPMHAPVVGTVGRLAEVKRQDVLIRAFARLRQAIPESHLVLVGDGPLISELGSLASQLGLDGCVHFAGYQSEPGRFLRAMDVFALTSRSEGMPLTVLEAWAMGLPVITSRVGGLPELIREGETGLMFDFGDEEALAAGLRLLLEDEPLAMKLGEAGREYVIANYDVSVMARTYAAHYARLLGREPAVSVETVCCGR